MNLGDVVTIAPPFGDSLSERVVSGIVDADTSLVWDGRDHSAYANFRLTFVRTGGEYPLPPTVDPTVWHITKLAFRNRFQAQEKVTIEIASLDNPAATMEQRALAASLRTYQADLQAATYIDLQRPDTRAGVLALEQYGLIAAGRAAQILDTLPTEVERYKA